MFERVSRAEGCSFIAPQRSNSAHHRRAWPVSTPVFANGRILCLPRRPWLDVPPGDEMPERSSGRGREFDDLIPLPGSKLAPQPPSRS